MSDIQIFDHVDMGGHGTLHFDLLVDGKRHKVRVSYEALQDHFGAEEDAISVMEAFRKNAEKIAEVAAAKIRDGDTEPMVGTTDL
jgi:hypothetical protein